MSWLLWLLRAWWAAATCGAALGFLPRGRLPALVAAAAARGKLWSPAAAAGDKADKARPLLSQLWSVSVPQSWFAHFYVVACVWTPLVLLFVVLNVNHVHGLGYGYSTAVLLLFELHAARRLYETARVMSYPPATARMHLAGYAFGLCYYMLVPVTLVAELLLIKNADEATRHKDETWWRQLVGVALYLIAMLGQHDCHKRLAALRRHAGSSSNKSAGNYAVPRGGAFELVSCPHYTFEIVLYVGLLMVAGVRNVTLWLLLAWVVANLALAARHTHAWYHKKFKEDYPASRRALVPILF